METRPSQPSTTGSARSVAVAGAQIACCCRLLFACITLHSHQTHPRTNDIRAHSRGTTSRRSRSISTRNGKRRCARSATLMRASLCAAQPRLATPRLSGMSIQIGGEERDMSVCVPACVCARENEMCVCVFTGVMCVREKERESARARTREREQAGERATRIQTSILSL